MFQSQASDLSPVQPDRRASDIYDVYLYSRSTGAVALISHSYSMSDGTAFGFSGSQSISADGSFVAFSSDAGDLVPLGDVNGSYDVFLYTTATGASIAGVARRQQHLGRQRPF